MSDSDIWMFSYQVHHESQWGDGISSGFNLQWYFLLSCVCLCNHLSAFGDSFVESSLKWFPFSVPCA
jgi:hypothetical protein